MNKKRIKYITQYSNTLFTYNNICGENPPMKPQKKIIERHYIVMAKKRKEFKYRNGDKIKCIKKWLLF